MQYRILMSGSSKKYRPPYDYTWIGFVVGIFAPIIVGFLVYQFQYDGSGVDGFRNFISYSNNTLSALMSFSLLGNLAAFFLFLWRNKLYAGRGVIFATFIYGAIILYLKFLA